MELELRARLESSRRRKEADGSRELAQNPPRSVGGYGIDSSFQRAPRAGRRAFTLVELLVVIARTKEHAALPAQLLV